MKRHPFRTPPEGVGHDYDSLLAWIRREHPGMPLTKASRIAEIQVGKVAVAAMKKEALAKIRDD